MQEYFVGLDMGTGSTGWAVTDDKYEILRAHGKALWGVRLFETANTAEERRNFRTARRRLARRNWRIQLLQELFAEEINKVDDGFFLRLKESRYLPEDKRDMQGVCPNLPYALFTDPDYTDKTYHKQFPTVYHLRNWLMETKEIPDIRLVYLALHHMMKHRGHFLFSGNFAEVRVFKNIFQQFIGSIKAEELDFEICGNEKLLDEIENVLKDRNIAKSVKKTKLITLLSAKTSCEKAVCGLISGGTVKLSDLFSQKELDDSEMPKLCFSDSNYEENCDKIETALGERYVIIEQAKAVYDWAVLTDILGDEPCISKAKMQTYEKHKQDLKYLKRQARTYLTQEECKELFTKTDGNFDNYCAYIGLAKVNGKKQPLQRKQCTKQEFYAYLKKKVLPLIKEQKDAEYLEQELEKGTFLPKQVVSDNAVIPHQVHLQELEAILCNLKDKIPVIKAQEDKIKQLFTFRIPYYVGPLNGIVRGGQSTNWVVRRTNEKIYPWNFNDVIDIEESAERFITRMTNKCTYLPQEDVLPKMSLLYSKFEVLNELNNLRLNGEPISVELKQKLYKDLFQCFRKVTRKKLESYLRREGQIEPDGTTVITGVDGDFKASLTAYHDFKEKLTGCSLSNEEQESIIKNITLFGADRKLLEKRLSRLYPQLTQKQVKSLCALHYTGWGRLSKAFLENVTAPAPETGEEWSIIQGLWETNDNLMQLLSAKYHFVQSLEKATEQEVASGLTYEMVDGLSLSPAVKRQVWQTLQIVRELCHVMGNPPKRIFVEMAREKKESQRTVSRKMHLLDLYHKCKGEERDFIQALNTTQEQNLRGDKLYLYYIQKGRCMYTGERIPLEDLWDKNKYDIDHIYPQSKVMDDSIDNRVLVKKQYNADKTDNYPIAKEIRDKMQDYWKCLLEGDFISKEKYKRLTRRTPFEEAELAGFIARQLVETRQSTKAVASVLKQLLPDTEIVYVKAKNVSQFRSDFKLPKVREMNDLHHAKDAYLNVVVGNVYFTKFTKDALWFLRNNPGRSYNLKRMFDYDVVRNGELSWKAKENGTIQVVKQMMGKNNILVTRRAYQVKGGLFDDQIVKKGKGQVPIKGNEERLKEIDKYGAYNKATGTYFMLVQSEDKKGRKLRTIEYMPLYLAPQLAQSREKMLAYLASERQLKNPEIILDKIKIDTLFRIDGFYMWLSGRSSNVLVFKNANQLLLSEQESAILKKVLKFVERRKERKGLQIVTQDQLTKEDLLALYDTFFAKLQNSIYAVKLGTQAKALKEKKEKFVALCPEDQCVVLSEILHLFQCQSGTANLSLIDGVSRAGIITLNYNITDVEHISIVNQSCTGIYEQVIDLKAL